MKTMKIWRITFAVLAAFSLASCSSDDNMERRLTTNQKEMYAQNISGEYSGEYIIIYKDKEANILVSISLSIRTRIARI